MTFSKMPKSIQNDQGSSAGVGSDTFYMTSATSTTNGGMGTLFETPDSVHIGALATDCVNAYTTDDTIKLSSTEGVRGTPTSITLHAGSKLAQIDSTGLTLNEGQFLGMKGGLTKGFYYTTASTVGTIASVVADNLEIRGGTTDADLTLTPTSITNYSYTILPLGSASNCAIQFADSANTGVYKIADNHIALVANGTKVLTHSASSTDLFPDTPTGVSYNADGSVSAPGICWSGDGDCGIYRVSAGLLKITAAGAANGMELTSSNAKFPLGFGLPPSSTLLNRYSVGTVTGHTQTIGGTNQAFTSSTVRYCRVGRLCVVHVNLAWNTNLALSGAWLLTNLLPFTAAVDFTTPRVLSSSSSFSTYDIVTTSYFDNLYFIGGLANTLTAYRSDPVGQVKTTFNTDGFNILTGGISFIMTYTTA